MHVSVWRYTIDSVAFRRWKLAPRAEAEHGIGLSFSTNDFTFRINGLQGFLHPARKVASKPLKAKNNGKVQPKVQPREPKCTHFTLETA